MRGSGWPSSDRKRAVEQRYFAEEIVPFCLGVDLNEICASGSAAADLSSFSFAVNKDLVQLQRDLEDRINAMQQSINSKLDTLNGMLQAMQNDTRRTADQLATLQDAVTNGVAKSLAPVGA